MEVMAERNAQGAELRLSHDVTGVQTSAGRLQVTASPEGGSPVTETFDDLVVATPAPIAAKLVAALPDEMVGSGTRSYLESQKYEPALSVSYLASPGSLPSEAHIVAGGPDDPPLRNMITYPRRVKDAQGRWVDKLLVFTYPGRANTRRLIGRSPEEQFAEVTPLLKTLWPDFPADAGAVPDRRTPLRLPDPSPGRYRRSVRVTREQGAPVVFAGDYFDSPTTEAAMLSGFRAAETLTSAG